MSPAMSWIVIGIFVGLPTLAAYCALRIASRADREMAALHESELKLGIALARAEQLRREHAFWNRPENRRIEIDLDDCRDAGEVRRRLAGSLTCLGDDEPTHTAE